MNKSYQKSKLGYIPKDWNISKIKDLGHVQTGTTPSKQKSSYWGGNYLWATAQDFNRKYGIFQKCPKLVDNFSKNFLIWRYHSYNITSNW